MLPRHKVCEGEQVGKKAQWKENLWAMCSEKVADGFERKNGSESRDGGKRKRETGHQQSVEEMQRVSMGEKERKKEHNYKMI